MIRDIQTEVRDGVLGPVRAAALLTKLTALYGSVLDEVRAADRAYAELLVEIFDSGEPISRAKVRAQTTPQYARVREAKDTASLSLELIRSLKKFLTLQAEELRLGK